MAHCRRIISILLIALIVATGVLASTHTHAHVGEDGTREIHVGHCAHECCGHGHSHDSPSDHSDEQPFNSPEDHEDCQICRMLADFQTTTLVVPTPTVYETLVIAQIFQPDREPTDRFLPSVFARGPPTLVAIDA